MKKSLIGAVVCSMIVGYGVPASATTVCFKQGGVEKCVTFTTPAPEAPVTTKGVKASLSKTKLVGDDSTTMTASGFVKGEYVRAFIFNVFGRKAATELSGGAIASAKGVARVTYGTFSLVSVSEQRTMCLRGERSQRMACLPFTYEG
jgi:hypothetical protein